MDLQADFSNISAARRTELKANSHLMLPELKTLFDNHIQDIIRRIPQFSLRPQQATTVLTRMLNPTSV